MTASGSAFPRKSEITPHIDTVSAPAQRERLAAIITEFWAEGPTVDLALMADRRFNKTTPEEQRDS